MKENKIKVRINKPIREVFEFTTDPKNTHLWIPSIEEEISDTYPPRVDTIYKNKGSSGNWNSYTVIEFEENKLFTLKSVEGDYTVRYSYREIEGETELEYYEWMEQGSLEHPFTQDILQTLKDVLEK